MTRLKPIFKRKEVVIDMPQKGSVLNLGERYTNKATVRFIGQECTKYKVGDEILYVHVKGMEEDRGRELELNGKKFMILESEDRVQCQVIEETDAV